MSTKYTKEVLDPIVPTCYSFAQLARLLQIQPIGSNTTNLKIRCCALGIDTSHFTGQSHLRGKTSSRKLVSSDIFVMGHKMDRRRKPHLLHRAMQEAGTPYLCGECGMLPVWQGLSITFQIDHRDGQYWNNTQDNLRYLCPNCHSQTLTWGSRNKRSRAAKVDGQS